MIAIFLRTQSKKEEIVAFLDKLKELLGKEDFNIDTDLTLIRKKKQGNDQKYSTPYTLLDLDYDAEDVVERLKELTVAEYSETKIDKDDLNPPLLFVFGKNINNKQVYVKLIDNCETSWLVCKLESNTRANLRRTRILQSSENKWTFWVHFNKPQTL